MNSKSITLYAIYSILIAGLYFGSGIITKPLILPPTYAAPIWPAAGIGVGVIILWGYRFIPAILIGEILINLKFYQFDQFSDNPELIVTYSSMLLATVLRSVLGAYLVKRYLGKTNNFLTIQSITKLLLLAGLVPTFFSASISTAALVYSNLLQVDSVLMNFLTWWYGDSVGVFTILPLMFLVFKKPRDVWQPRLLKTAIPVCLCFILLILITNPIKRLVADKVSDTLEDKIQILSYNTFGSIDPSIYHTSNNHDFANSIKKLIPDKVVHAIAEFNLENIYFLISLQNEDEEKIIYESGNNKLESTGFNSQKTYKFGDQTWIIKAYPTSNFYGDRASWVMWWLLSIGFLFIAIMGAGLLIISGSNIIIKQQVQKRTQEIKTLNDILKVSEHRYKQIVEIQPVIFWKHDLVNHKLDFISNEAVNMLGYSKNELLETDTILYKIFHPNERSGLIKKYYQGIKSKKRFTLKYRAFSKEGKVFWFKDFISTRIVDGNTEVLGLKIDITIEKENEQKIAHLAFYDSMTKLPNRVQFMALLNKSINKTLVENTFGAIIYFDLDRFKVLNDSLGHYFGDKLLVKIAKRLKTILSKDDVASRFGGDEFVVLINKKHQTVDETIVHANRIANDVHATINKPFDIEGHKCFTTISTGISVFPQDSEFAEEIIQQADIAMYASKSKGKNTISLFQKSMQEKVNNQLEIEKSLNEALQNNEFEMYYQSIFDQNKKTIGLEALIRWNHPEQGLLYPNSFMNIAEETGFIIELSDWIIDDVFAQINLWNKEYDKMLPVSINISMFQFKNTQLISRLNSYSQKHNINTGNVILELTETIEVEDIHDAMKTLGQLKEMGYKLAIDDFGTGYSSLNYLSQMPIDILKLDMSFVAQIGEKTNSDALIEIIVLMADKLSLLIVVEGVETQFQFDFLKNLGCEKFQGHFVSTALPANQINLK